MRRGVKLDWPGEGTQARMGYDQAAGTCSELIDLDVFRLMGREAPCGFQYFPHIIGWMGGVEQGVLEALW